jgi:predicted DNA-binding protein
MGYVKSTFTLPEELVNELNEFTKETGFKKSNIIAKALEMYFDYLDLKIAEKRMKEIEDENLETVSLEDMKKELGI